MAPTNPGGEPAGGARTRKGPRALLLGGLPVAVGALAGFYGAAALVGPGAWRYVLTAVLFLVSGLATGFVVDRFLAGSVRRAGE